MKAELQTIINDIEQSLALLRRHLCLGQLS